MIKKIAVALALFATGTFTGLMLAGIVQAQEEMRTEKTDAARNGDSVT